VVLLHGIGGGAAIWGERGSDTVQALVRAGYRAVAVDLPGYGQAVAEPVPDMAALVQAVQGVLAELRAAPQAPAQVVLLGHSMGGMVAQALMAAQVANPRAEEITVAEHGVGASAGPRSAVQGAGTDPAQHPAVGWTQGRVQGLVLACTSAAFGKPAADWQARFLAERLAPLDAGLGMAALADQLVPGLLAPQASSAARQAARDVMAAVPEATYRAVLRAIAGFDGRAALPHLHGPALLLAAEHDRTAPPEMMQRMAGRLPQATFVCLPDAGHIANVEAPLAFNAAVLGFLRRHFPVA
jgi:pimeloyl-ACP methyl ester carboxylesterase